MNLRSAAVAEEEVSEAHVKVDFSAIEIEQKRIHTYNKYFTRLTNKAKKKIRLKERGLRGARHWNFL